MAANITLTLDPGEVPGDLERIAHLLSNLDEWLLIVGGLVSDQMSINWSEASWAPLAAATILKKQTQGWPLDILVETGALRDAASGGAWSASQMGGSAEAVLEAPGYGEFHITGTSYMPARDWTFLPASIVNDIEDSLVVFLVG